MTETIEHLSDYIGVIHLEGEPYLGIRISDSRGNRSVKQFVERGLTPGYVVHGTEVEAWEPIGLTEFEDRIYLYGPYFEGRTVNSILKNEPRSAFSFVERLARAVEVLNGRDLNLPTIQTNGIFFLDDGGTLVLPPIILERLRNIQIEADRFDTYEIYNHPDLTGERAVVFSLGVLSYRIATGELPYDTEDDVELHHEMRELEPIAPEYRNPEVTPEASRTLVRSISPSAEPIPISDMRAAVSSWARGDAFAPVTPDQKEALLERGQRIRSRKRSSYNRRRFMRRNGRTLITVTLIVAVAASLGVSIIRNLTAPRITLGMEPLQVVETLYAGISELDHAAVEDALADGVGRAEINEATNLYVLSRMRLGNEGSVGYVSPQVWFDNGAPRLQETNYIYGIYKLSIEATAENRFVAEYEKWEQTLTETLAYRVPEANSTVRERRDVLTLEWDGTYWLISDIDRQVDRYIPPEEVELPEPPEED